MGMFSPSLETVCKTNLKNEKSGGDRFVVELWSCEVVEMEQW